jgi:hypothetical protein
MDEPSLNAFLDRYYAWSVQQAVREVSSDFESIRAVQGTAAQECWAAMRRFLPSARRDLAVALVKKRHRKELNAVERELYARFKTYVDDVKSSISQEGRRASLTDRATFRKLLRKKAPGVLGEMRVESVEFFFTLDVAGNQLKTIVDTGGRARQLEYTHTIWLAGARYPASEIPISLMAWLGLSSSTRWDVVPRGHEGQAVDRLLDFGSRFIAALPGLLGVHDS